MVRHSEPEQSGLPRRYGPERELVDVELPRVLGEPKVCPRQKLMCKK